MGLTMAYGGNTRHLWYSEYDPDASHVLAQHLPGVPNLGDLKAIDWASLPRVDVLTAGFPCQPVSAAGRQKATDDERWLWPHVLQAIRTLRPQEILLENVRNLVSIQKGTIFAQILTDLRDAGYAVRWSTAGACAVGGAHHRHRVFIVARYAWQLDPPPAEHVVVGECGARRGKGRTLLPTPTAARYGNNQGGQNPDGPVRHSLDEVHKFLPERVADELEVGPLLPTPTCSDGMGGPGSNGRAGGDNLRTAAALLPDPAGDMLPTPTAGDERNSRNITANRSPDKADARLGYTLCDVAHLADDTGTVGVLLPTPCARDGKGGDDHSAQRRQAGLFDGGDNLPTVAQQLAPTLFGTGPQATELLPTPRASDEVNGSPNQHGKRGDLMLSSAVIGERYGKYAAAVTLWAQVSGRPAPEPTIRNAKGQWRLSPWLPEWMMGYPTGWIVPHVKRGAALRLAGNGVVPQVVAAVYPLLTRDWPYLQGGETCPDDLTRAAPPVPGTAGSPRLGGRAGGGRGRGGVSAAPAAEQLALPV